MKNQILKNILSMFIFVAIGIIYDEINSMLMFCSYNIYIRDIILPIPYIILNGIAGVICIEKIWECKGSPNIQLLKKIILMLTGMGISYITHICCSLLITFLGMSKG